MRVFRVTVAVVLAMVALVGVANGADPSWPKEVTFGLLSTENATEITCAGRRSSRSSRRTSASRSSR
jgi:ABC-type phosphate/phosphonate transport system substrate-binding protein